MKTGFRFRFVRRGRIESRRGRTRHHFRRFGFFPQIQRAVFFAVATRTMPVLSVLPLLPVRPAMLILSASERLGPSTVEAVSDFLRWPLNPGGPLVMVAGATERLGSGTHSAGPSPRVILVSRPARPAMRRLATQHLCFSTQLAATACAPIDFFRPHAPRVPCARGLVLDLPATSTQSSPRPLRGFEHFAPLVLASLDQCRACWAGPWRPDDRAVHRRADVALVSPAARH